MSVWDWKIDTANQTVPAVDTTTEATEPARKKTYGLIFWNASADRMHAIPWQWTWHCDAIVRTVRENWNNKVPIK